MPIPADEPLLMGELLEARLATQPDDYEQHHSHPPSSSSSKSSQEWSVPSFVQPRDTAPSPTAFLEMLSSAATAQASAAAEASSSVPGLRDGAVNAMMSATWATTPKEGNNASTGLTPFLSFADNQHAQPQTESEGKREQSGVSPSARGSRRSSSYNGGVSSYATSTNSPTSAGGPMPSPVNFLNFSPAPSAAEGSSRPQAQPVQRDPPNVDWPPPPGPDGHLQPSTRTEGSWRGVETISNYMGNSNDADAPAHNKPAEPEAPAADVNEAIQQQLLLDIFWPGWPSTLPEPHIVNDLYVFHLNFSLQ